MNKTIEKENILGDLLTEAPASVPARANGTGVARVEPPRSMLELIDRASRDPAVDVDKLKTLLELSERVQARDAKVAYLAALAAMKPKLPVIERMGHIVIHEKGKEKIPANVIQDTAFARWEDIDEAITPILTAHNFILTFRSDMATDGKVQVIGNLAHAAGHSEQTTITLPHDSSGSKNPVQAVGSSLSYGKRYAATLLLNIRTKGEDDDGNEAGADEELSPVQIEQITDMLTRDGADVEKFCTLMKIDAIARIKREDFEATVKKINEVSLARAAAKAKAAQK